MRQPNIDSRADGGFINPDNARPRDRRMRWTDSADRQLLIFGFGRDINSSEYQAISDTYPEKPTTKAVQERITKLRVATRKALKDSGIYDHSVVVKPPPSEGTANRTLSIPCLPTSSPAKLPSKKTRPSSTSSNTRATLAPPSASTPTPRPQPPPEQQLQLPQGPPSFQPAQPQPPQMGLQGAQAHQTPPAYPTPANWQPRFAPGAAVANMYTRAVGSPQPTLSQMSMPPMGAPTGPPYMGQFGGTYAGSYMFPGSAGMGMGMGMSNYQFQPHQHVPGFGGESFTPSYLPQQPAGAALNPPVPDMGGFVEGEEEDPMVRSERDFQAKQAEREAVSDRENFPVHADA